LFFKQLWNRSRQVSQLFIVILALHACLERKIRPPDGEFLKKNSTQFVIVMLAGVEHNVMEIGVQFFKNVAHPDEIRTDAGNCYNGFGHCYLLPPRLRVTVRQPFGTFFRRMDQSVRICTR
jgi:hypothetical protein